MASAIVGALGHLHGACSLQLGNDRIAYDDRHCLCSQFKAKLFYRLYLGKIEGYLLELLRVLSREGAPGSELCHHMHTAAALFSW